MDKYEYKITLQELNALIGERRFDEAARLADTVDWNKVKTIKTLCMVSDVYKINREYEKARSVMKVALRRLQIMPQPDTREQQEEFERNQALVIYNLCELTIFLYGRNNLQSDLASALTLVQEYSQIQPENPKRLVLQYKMYQVSPVSMNEKIAILEKLRQEKHTQRWGYELALLYHQAGRDEDAVKECLDITAQFSGKYANKAADLLDEIQGSIPETSADTQDHLQQNVAEGMRDIYRGGNGTPQEPLQEPSPEPEADAYAAPEQGYNLSAYDTPEQGFNREEARTQAPERREQRGQSRAAETVNGQSGEKPEQETHSSQRSISQVMQEWDQVRRGIRSANDEKRAQRILEDTGPIMRDFDETARHGLLEDIEKNSNQAIRSARSAAAAVPVSDGLTGSERARAAAAAGNRFNDLQPLEQDARADETGSYADTERDGDTDSYTNADRGLNADTYTGTDAGYTAPDSYSYAGADADYRADETYPMDEVQEAYPAQDEAPETLQQEDAREEEQEASVPAEAAGDRTGTVVYFGDHAAAPQPGAAYDDMPDHEAADDDAAYDAVGPDAGKTAVVDAVETQPVEGESAPQDGADEDDLSTRRWNPSEVRLAMSRQQARFEAARKRLDAERAARQAAEAEREAYGTSLEENLTESGQQFTQGEDLDTGDSCEEAYRDTAPEEYAEEPEEAPEEEPEADSEEYAEEPEEEPEADSEEYAEEPAEAPEEEPEADPEEYAEEPEEAPEEELEADSEGSAEEPDEAPEEDAGHEPEEEPAEEQEPLPEEEDVTEEEPENAAPAEADEDRQMSAAVKLDDGQEMQAAAREVRQRKAAPSGLGSLAGALTDEQKHMFGPLFRQKENQKQIFDALDQISLEPDTGNLIITGPRSFCERTAQSILEIVHAADPNFSGKTAKANGKSINALPEGQMQKILAKIDGGALVIGNASVLTEEAIARLKKSLSASHGIILILMDTRRAMDTLLAKNSDAMRSFDARIDIRPLGVRALTAYGKEYALSKDYVLDTFAELQLASRIAALNVPRHHPTINEVQEIVDAAIAHASRKSLHTLWEIITRKRYDKDDRIILHEKDFIEGKKKNPSDEG
ncbi:MAG TPA: hypothetical protein DCM43_04795 [Lachnospiraceae bacterium]|nr:hypothetical protein [Lachnospiraceae bacterium]